MGTIGAVIQAGRAYLLGNFDYRPVATGRAWFESASGGYGHFALVDHARLGVNCGLNEAGLGLLSSGSGWEDPATPEGDELGTPEGDELGTVLSAEVLEGDATVEAGVARLEAYAAAHPAMLGGSVILADERRISVTEHFGGRACTETTEDGYLARADHSLLGLAETRTEDGERRCERMVDFLQELYAWLPALDRDDVCERCRGLLRTEPILTPATRSSLVIDLQERRVDHGIGDGPWRAFFLDEPFGRER